MSSRRLSTVLSPEEVVVRDESWSYEGDPKYAAEVMRHMLFRNLQQPNVPVTRAQLRRLVPKSTFVLFYNVIPMAQKQLMSIFGLEMKALERGKANIVYVLRSAVPEPLMRKHVGRPVRESTAAQQGFALVVVGIVKSWGGEQMPEEELFKHLRSVGVTPGENHPVFGHVGRALNALARQRYIRKERSEGADRNYIYSLAERADDWDFRRRFNVFLSRHTRTRKQRR